MPRVDVHSLVGLTTALGRSPVGPSLVQVVKLPESQGGVPRDKPLTVLVNGGTASVSEILTGALRDNRGALIGELAVG